MGVFRVCQLFGRYVGDLNKVVAIRYFQLPNSDGINTISCRKYYRDGIYSKY